MAIFFAQKDRLVRWCVVLALAATLCAVLSLVVALGATTQPMRFIVLDRAGNVFVAQGRVFDEARELHVEQALLATTTLLLRNANNFDLPELVPSLFAASGFNQAQALKTGETPEFQAKQIQQKPIVTKLEALETRPDLVRVQVTGQLLRTGVFQQQPFSEVVPFVLDLVLKHNPDLLRNRRQPTVVVEFKLRYEISH
jgi:hypothetical protein